MNTLSLVKNYAWVIHCVIEIKKRYPVLRNERRDAAFCLHALAL